MCTHFKPSRIISGPGLLRAPGHLIIYSDSALGPSNHMKRARNEEEAHKSALEETDPEIFSLLTSEKERQRDWLNLIASENIASEAVLEVLGSVLTNKYAEGYPGARHYGGNCHIDKIELLCQQRALSIFNLNPAVWGVNVQSLAGSIANFQVYAALMRPHDRLMGLNLTHGGHMSFGYYQNRVRVSMASVHYETMSYDIDFATGQIDYADLESSALKFRPKVIIAGASSYCRHINFSKIKEICTKVGAYLVADIAHTAGLVAAGAVPGPFKYADVITTATQKTLRGPRGALIYYKKELEKSINFSVFPSSQGGPHNHTIAALAVALKEASTPEFQAYQFKLLSNAKALEQELVKRGYLLVNGGTDIHMVVVSLISKKLEGIHLKYACERAHISLSCTSVPGDSGATPRAVRLGTTSMTSRGFVEKDFVKCVDYFDKVVKVTAEIKASIPADPTGTKIKAALLANQTLKDIATEIKSWVGKLPLAGI